MTSSKSEFGFIKPTQIVEEMRSSYLDYAMSVIVSRALPDARDGLKPVQRRILYAMNDLGMRSNSAHKKSARLVGEVLGKWHPHGEMAVYDAMVRLAQDFTVRMPLVDGQGNFGSIDNDPAAAMRYTEARLSSVADEMLANLDQETVDWTLNFDDTLKEPVVLPARFPNLLANGATGIAVGMATSIPPHNVGELCDALSHLIRFPNAQFEKLAEYIPGPDFPTGGTLIEPRDSIVEAYRTGRGSFRIRAKWTIEKLGRGVFQIVVTEIPYQVQKSHLIEKVAELLNGRKLPLLADVRDESAEDVRILLEPRSRSVDPEMLMEHMFRQTDLEIRFSLNLNVLSANNTPRVMNLREALQAFLDHRMDVLIRESRHQLAKIERRLEILGGLLIVYLNLDEIIHIIREEDEPKIEMMKAFDVSEVQADAILNMRLRQLRKLEEIGIEKENKELVKEHKELTALLKHEKRRWKAISAEIAAIKKRFGPNNPLGRRRTEIRKPPTAVIVRSFTR